MPLQCLQDCEMFQENFILVKRKSIVKNLKEQWGHNKGTPIMEQGTMSGCVLDLSKLFGCRKYFSWAKIMCIRDDGKYYTDDSSYADSGTHYSKETRGHKLPGNTQESVLVEGRLCIPKDL